MPTLPAAPIPCVNHPEVLTHVTCDRCLRPHCPDCLIALQGQSVCAACKHTLLSAGFRSYTVMVPTRSLAAAAAVEAAPQSPVALESPCSMHANQHAVALCDRCGDFICLLCLTPFEGRSYCLRCFELLWGRGEFGGRNRTWKAWENPVGATVCVVIAWLCVIAPYFSFLPALAGVLMASAALRRIGQEPDRPGKRAVIGVIIAGALAMLASVGITILLFW